MGIRPEGFILDENGPFSCHLRSVEVMGRDSSVVATNVASLNPLIRAVMNAEHIVKTEEIVRFSLKPGKVFLFDRESEERIGFEVAL